MGVLDDSTLVFRPSSSRRLKQMPVAILESESHRVLVAHLRRFCFLLSSIMATIRRRQVQAFIEQDRSDDPKRLQRLEPKFRQVIQTGRAKCPLPFQNLRAREYWQRSNRLTLHGTAFWKPADWC
jgi:hypothetical protein